MAIKHFVGALVSVFGTGGGKSPLGLYNRLICHVEGKDSIHGVEKYINGFNNFLSEFGGSLESNEDLLTIPRDTIIKYGDSDKIFIEIQKFIYKSRLQKEQLEIIRQHLLTISATIKPDENLLVALEKAPTDTSIVVADGEDFGSAFIKHEMDTIREVLENLNVNIDMSDPDSAMGVMVALANSGAIEGMIKRLKDAADSGKIDPPKMLTYLQKILTDLMGDAEGIDLDAINQLSATMISQMQASQSSIEDVDVD